MPKKNVILARKIKQLNFGAKNKKEKIESYSGYFLPESNPKKVTRKQLADIDISLCPKKTHRLPISTKLSKTSLVGMIENAAFNLKKETLRFDIKQSKDWLIANLNMIDPTHPFIVAANEFINDEQSKPTGPLPLYKLTSDEEQIKNDFEQIVVEEITNEIENILGELVRFQ